MAWGLKPNPEKVRASDLFAFMCVVDRMKVSTLFCILRINKFFPLPFFSAFTGHGPNEEGGSEEAADGEVTAKQPKKKRPPKRTVEQNLSNINGADSERKCEV